MRTPIALLLSLASLLVVRAKEADLIRIVIQGEDTGPHHLAIGGTGAAQGLHKILTFKYMSPSDYLLLYVDDDPKKTESSWLSGKGAFTWIAKDAPPVNCWIEGTLDQAPGDSFRRVRWEIAKPDDPYKVACDVQFGLSLKCGGEMKCADPKRLMEIA